ncbi:hypothetical protein RvY_04394-3 [Ramazzottius varieornatus]|uniref:Major facilitator superfamily (MFS) profile domain-containing protein n=1 Tax=Ramazzottius varieornatus TaxID=947166 RepID=A0A1D1URJ1_RAMVA|nr:hypothetical protein RvY_04394-3 [Ramazzottius varieornatus]
MHLLVPRWLLRAIMTPNATQAEKTTLLDLSRDVSANTFGASKMPAKNTVTRWLGLSIFTTALGSSFLFGYHVGVLNAPQTVMGLWVREVKCRRSVQDIAPADGAYHDHWCKQLNFTEELTMFTDNAELNTLWSLAVAALIFASFFGAISASTFANKIGRRGTLWWNSVLGVVAAAVLACSYLADSFEMLILGRLVAGFASGINTALPPVYLNEISPRTLRGAIGAIHPFAAAIGLLVSRILGLPYILGNEWGWPILLAVSVIPMMYQLVAFPFCPESPRYLFVEKSDESATRHGKFH